MSTERGKIESIKIQGLLSFGYGEEGIDLPLKNLNVFIGANASGKSNFFEILNLIRNLPKGFQHYVQSNLEVENLAHKPLKETGISNLEILFSGKNKQLLHNFQIRNFGNRVDVGMEVVSDLTDTPPQLLLKYEPLKESSIFTVFAYPNERQIVNLDGFNSIFSQVKNQSTYPELFELQQFYESFLMYRDWYFGPKAPIRTPVRPDHSSSYLLEQCQNLVQVLNKVKNKNSKELDYYLSQLYDGYSNIEIEIEHGFANLFLFEKGGVSIPLSRLSDGTIRYLTLLAILLNPTPSPITVIEEPELGLHPDNIPVLAELLVDASTRTQLFVSTHSRILADALNEHPECIVACEQRNGISYFHRLTQEDTKQWLENYSLGDAWSRGFIGANRW